MENEKYLLPSLSFETLTPQLAADRYTDYAIPAS
jgi:hypothetical protein